MGDLEHLRPAHSQEYKMSETKRQSRKDTRTGCYEVDEVKGGKQGSKHCQGSA
jgi:hypothetical protein